VLVYGIDPPGVEAFVEEMRGDHPIPERIEIARSPDQAIAEADIVCTATTSSIPVFDGRNLKAGTHINAVGAFTPKMQEIDAHTVKASIVVVDSIEAAQEEAGDLIIPVRQGLFDWNLVHAELGEIINGSKTGRTTRDQITLFKSVGIAIQDAAAASYALAEAERESIGSVIQL
jgi:ornithine cyclodeaminase/alanine dehydrogenase-like protein (mu-crystallin family)